MRPTSPLSLLSCLVCLVLINGCSEPNATNTASTEAALEPESIVAPERDSGEQQIASSQAEDGDVGMATPKEAPPVDFGPWLEPPTATSSRLASRYTDTVQSIVGGDQQDMGKLASLSEQVATELMQKEQEASGYAFFGQAGRALRQAMSRGDAGVPESSIGRIFYNEACAMAKSEKTDAALTALKEAFANGFSDLDLLASDSDLDNLRSLDKFKEHVTEWKQQALEKIKQQAREELEEGESFPFTLSLQDIDGGEQNLESLVGKVVIVDIWGTWCPPCRAEVPSFIKLQEKYGDNGFQMLGVNYERGADEEANVELVANYVEETGINYPCVMGDDATRDQIPNFRGYPTTLFIDKSGTVRLKLVGLHDYELLDALVAELLAEG